MTIFIDSNYFIALYNPTDSLHEKAKRTVKVHVQSPRMRRYLLLTKKRTSPTSHQNQITKLPQRSPIRKITTSHVIIH